MSEFKYTQFLDLSGSKSELHSGSWEQFCENIIVNPPTGNSKNELPLIKLQEFGDVRTKQNSLRHNANVLKVYGIEGDYDKEVISFEDAVKRLKAYNIKAFVYTTPSHTKQFPRWRVLAPLAEGVSPSEHHNLVAKLNGALGGILATESFTLSQAMFLGQVVGTPYQCEILDGQYIDKVKGITPIGNRTKERTGEAKEPSLVPLSVVKEMLECLDPNMPEPDWRKIGAIIHLESGGSEKGFDIFYDWSMKATRDIARLGEASCRLKWENYNDNHPDAAAMGSLRKLAIEAGYKEPESVKKYFDKENPWSNRIVNFSEKSEATNWTVNGILADKMTMIAGSPGVGKTSCLVPLSLVVAGFQEKGSNIVSKYPRKVVYLTEDVTQVNSLIHGIVKHMELKNGSKITLSQIAERFIMVETKKSKMEEIIKLAELANDYSEELRGVEQKPLIVFDTASASFYMDDENHNSEASKFVSGIKENFVNKGFPVWIVAHVAKGLKRKKVEDMSVRGAGAFEGDANCIAYLVEEENVTERFFVLGKHRYTAKFKEIIIDSETYDETLFDRFGEPEDSSYRYSRLHIGSEIERLTAKEEAKDEKTPEIVKARKDRIIANVIQEGEISISDLVSRTTGRGKNKPHIEMLINEGYLEVLPGKTNGKRVKIGDRKYEK